MTDKVTYQWWIDHCKELEQRIEVLAESNHIANDVSKRLYNALLMMMRSRGVDMRDAEAVVEALETYEKVYFP